MLLNHSFFVFFNLFAWLLSGAVAAVPGTVYRGDKRKPADIKAAGGLWSKGSTHKLGPKGTLFEHVTKSLKYPQRDPFVSTTDDYQVAVEQIDNNGYVYYIDTTGLESRFYDCASEYRKAKKKYPYPNEREFSAEGGIPWSSIYQWDKIKNGQAVESTPNPDYGTAASGSGSRAGSKRGMEVPLLKKAGTPGAGSPA